MGLECTQDQALQVWQAHHREGSPNGDYTTHGLPASTLAFMNATTARLLPEPMLARYGLAPIDD